MRLFLDTSVLLAAAGCGAGSSRELFRLAEERRWILTCSPYVLSEVQRNLVQLPSAASRDWLWLREALTVVNDVLTIDRPHIFAKSKDRPILFTALAFCDVLLTLDRGDFGDLLDSSFYGLSVLKPGSFLGIHAART